MREPGAVRAARILPLHGLSMAEHYLMCTAGYRVNLERQSFIEHALREFEGGWPDITLDELASALTRLTEANLMRVLTEADVEAEKTRRASSRVPESRQLASLGGRSLPASAHGVPIVSSCCRRDITQRSPTPSTPPRCGETDARRNGRCVSSARAWSAGRRRARAGRAPGKARWRFRAPTVPPSRRPRPRRPGG